MSTNTTSTTEIPPATSIETALPSTATPPPANTVSTTVPDSTSLPDSLTLPLSDSTTVPITSLPPTTVVITSTSTSTTSLLPSSTSTTSHAPTTSSTSAPLTTSAPPVSSSPPSISVVTYTPTSDGSAQNPVTIIQTLTQAAPSTTSTSSSSASTTTPGLAGDSGNGTSTTSGLSGGGKTAVEVIVPIVAVALILLAGLWFWRRRKQQKDAEEIRRKEVEEYGYNPNEDPTIPAVGGTKTTGDGPFEMQQDGAGYRGWGTTAVGSQGRKASTTLGSAPLGMAYSEGTSPSQGPISDARSGDTLIGSPTGRPISDGSEEVLGAMGPAAAGNRGGDMHRGPSNASSSYSAANRSDASGEGAIPGGAHGAAQYYGDVNYGGPYADQSYGASPPGRAEMSGQPVIRDNLARRATRIENPSHFPTQASAGISQNF